MFKLTPLFKLKIRSQQLPKSQSQPLLSQLLNNNKDSKDHQEKKVRVNSLLNTLVSQEEAVEAEAVPEVAAVVVEAEVASKMEVTDKIEVNTEKIEENTEKVAEVATEVVAVVPVVLPDNTDQRLLLELKAVKKVLLLLKTRSKETSVTEVRDTVSKESQENTSTHMTDKTVPEEAKEHPRELTSMRNSSTERRVKSNQ